jgi:cell division protein FtsZ
MSHPQPGPESAGGAPAAAHHVAAHASAAAQASPRHVPGNPQQPASRSGLFADPGRSPVIAVPASGAAAPGEPRPSLFRAVTGRLRNSLAAAGTHAAPTEPPPQRVEASVQEHRPEPVRASVRQAAGEEMGLEIPAFLRRQSS